MNVGDIAGAWVCSGHAELALAGASFFWTYLSLLRFRLKGLTVTPEIGLQKHIR